MPQANPTPVAPQQQTFGGKLLRGVVAPVVRAVNTPVQDILNSAGIHPNETNSYLGDVSGYGQKAGETTAQRVKDVAGGALQTAALLIPGGGEAVDAGIGATEAVAPTLGEKVAQGAITGAKAGTAYGAGAEASNNPDSTVGSIAEQGAIGGAEGAATGGAMETVGAGLNNIHDLITDHPIFKSGGGNAVATAQANLATAGQNAATAVGDITDAGNNVQSAAGQKFAQAGQQIDETGTTATLTPDQLDRLNQLKTSGKFALPDAFSQKTNPLLDAPQTPGEIENPGKQFTGSQMQDLIHQLNNSTFTDKVSGLGVDQGKVGLTNEIKDVAQQAFGSVKDAEGNPIWQKAYSDYSRTRGALDSISDIMSTKRNPTASELQSKIGTIQKLGSTPSGKVLLQNALSDFKGVTGYDLTDPVATIHQMVDKEIALETAQKGGFMKQFARGASNPSRLGGAITRLAILYPVISAIKNAMSGK